MPQTNFLVHDREKPEHPDSIVSVLYVDDEEDLLTIGKAFLERSGDFRVDILPSAEQALALPHLHTYDAIVSDYQMPVMDGIEFLKVFREKLPKIPFILFTGRGREEVVIEALNNGADFYLQKGGDPTAQFAELAHKIKRAVMQRKAEHSLFESERRYREVVETQTEFISRFTPDFVHLFVNDAYCRHFGLCREEIIGRVFIPTIPDEDSTIVREFFSLFTPENPDGQIEHRVILPDGSVHWHWRRDHAFFDDNGRITEFQSIGRDISVQRQAIDALKESEEKFRILADTAPIAIILYQDSRLLYVNDHVCRITGYTRDELYTMNFWEILHPDYQETAKTRGLARLRGDAAPARYDVKYFTRSGEEGWADLSAAIIQFRGKRTVLILMVGITERKVMEEELREAYEQLKEADEELQAQMFELDESQKRIRQNEYEYRTILKNLDGAFYRTDLQGNLILISPSFAEQFGYPGTNDIIGMNIRENFYLNPSDRDLFLAKIEKYGKVKDERVTLKRYDGSPVIVSISSHLFKDESGSPSGIEGVIHEITETVRIEEALEKSEEKFREMAERSSDLIIILNSRMSPDYVSPAARRIIQYDPEELVGKPPEFASSTIFSQAGPILMSAVGKTMNGEVVENVEIQVCRKDGVLIPVSLSAVPTIHNGTVDGAQVSMRDITAVRKVEQELKRSEEQYRLLADNVHDVIWTADTELHLTYISPSIEKSLGYTQKEMIGMDFSELVTPESFRKIQTLNEEHAEAMKAGKSLPKKIVLELEFSQRSGNTVWTEMMISPAFDANREFSGFVGVTRDITKRKEAEELLRKSEEQFRSFVENANDIVFSLTPDGTITYIPDKWSTIFGYGNNEVIGNPALRFIHPDDYPRIFDFITRKIIVKKEKAVVECRLLYKDGSWKWHSLNVIPVLDEEGNVVLLQGISHDINERKRNEDALKKANRQLSLLTGITRHDILNKVSIIFGFLELMEKGILDQSAMEYLSIIVNTTRDIQTQIEFTRIYEELGSHEPLWILLDLVIPRNQVPSDIILSTDIAGIEIFADPMFEKVFFNLLDNSLRHGMTVSEIRVSARKENDFLIVIWEDNGVGIAEKEKEKIFHRGFGKNNGLGMFLVREILSLTDITITENGKQGTGARFEIRVPYQSYRFTMP